MMAADRAADKPGGTSPPRPLSQSPSGASSDWATIERAAMAMTLDQAVAVANSLQEDLDAGRLHPPYPRDVRFSLLICEAVFEREAQTADAARAIIKRIAPRPAAETPLWGAA